MARKKEDKITTLQQWVEVTVRDGQTVTTYYPENEVMLKEMAELETKPTLVYRRLNFRQGVPREYWWVTRVEARRQNGGHGLQRLRLEDWLEALKNEAVTGHVSSVRIVPRPRARGGCECESCTRSRRSWEELGVEVA
jgi:hypothetical protein